MPVYEYSALNAKGKKVSGVIDAGGAGGARQKLRSSGVCPISVNEAQKSGGKGDDLSRFSHRGLLNRVSPQEISMVTRQLSTLVGAGFPLITAIDTLIPQTKSYSLKKTLARIKRSITEGNSFGVSLSSEFK